MTEALEGVAPEGTLQNVALASTVEERAPLFQFAHAIAGFLCVDLGHPPVVQKFAAPHGIAEVNPPIVGGIHIGHGGGDSTFGHHGVSFTQERFAYHSYAGSLAQSFNGRAKTSTASSDNKHVMFVSLVFAVHSSLKSLITPVDSRRT